jgi:hypothetical protein
MLLRYGTVGNECRSLLRVGELLVQLRLQHRGKRRVQRSPVPKGQKSPGKGESGLELIQILSEQMPNNAFEIEDSRFGAVAAQQKALF